MNYNPKLTFYNKHSCNSYTINVFVYNPVTGVMDHFTTNYDKRFMAALQEIPEITIFKDKRWPNEFNVFLRQTKYPNLSFFFDK